MLASLLVSDHHQYQKMFLEMLLERERRLRDQETKLKEREDRLLELEETERRYQALEASGQTAASQSAHEGSRAGEQAADKTRDAIQSLRAAEEAGGGDSLGQAIRLLEAPCAESAASALMALADVARSCDEEARGAVKAAQRAVRDVVVARCRSQAELGDREAFLEAAERAFGRPLDRDLRAVLLLAFHKVPMDKASRFLSNGQLEAARRGGRRRRRQRGAATPSACATSSMSGPRLASPLTVGDAGGDGAHITGPESVCVVPRWRPPADGAEDRNPVKHERVRQLLTPIEGAIVEQHVGVQRATCWGPYQWVTDLEEAEYHMKKLWFDLSEWPIVGVHVESHDDQVCVVQLASHCRGLVIDALALQGPAMCRLLQPLLAADRVCKVLHCHRSDLSWQLYTNFAVEVTPPIFDTSANATEFDGMREGEPPSLEALCREFLAYDLLRADHSADWSQRPLPEQMLQCAAIDAQVLPQLQAAIQETTNSRAWGYAWEGLIL